MNHHLNAFAASQNLGASSERIGSTRSLVATCRVEENMLRRIALSMLVSIAAMGIYSGAHARTIFDFLGGDSKYCYAESIDMIDKCPNDNVMLFQPAFFGNKQLPLTVIAQYCDYHRPVSFNEGGVVCVKVPRRNVYNVAEEEQKNLWKKFKSDIERAGWTQFNETGWVKVQKEGTGALPALPYKLTYSYQRLDRDGNPVGKAVEEVEEITDKTNYFYVGYKVGTEFEAAWFPEDLLKSSRARYKIIKAEPVTGEKEDDKDPEDSKPKKGKK